MNVWFQIGEFQLPDYIDLQLLGLRLSLHCQKQKHSGFAHQAEIHVGAGLFQFALQPSYVCYDHDRPLKFPSDAVTT